MANNNETSTEQTQAKYYKVDYASIPYEQLPLHMRIGLISFRKAASTSTSSSTSSSTRIDQDEFVIKVLLHPADALRALRLILPSGDPRLLDKPFEQVPPFFHLCHAFANAVCTRAMKLAGALNVNVRSEGNNRFKPGAEERECLHYHLLGRFEHSSDVLGVYQIDHLDGTTGDINLGKETNRKPLSRDPDENARLGTRVIEKFRPLLQQAFDELMITSNNDNNWRRLLENDLKITTTLHLLP